MAIIQYSLISLGALSASSLAYRLIRFIYVYTRPSSIPRYLHSQDSKPAWALVTGATAGIGRAFAFELAGRGFNVIVHGRSVSKLEALKVELKNALPSRDFRITILDTSLQGQELITGIEALVEELKDVHLTVLVNNVGSPSPAVYNLYSKFEESKTSDCDRFIDMNARFTIHLTRSLLPLLLQHQPALVLTIGSMADIGAPYLSVYGGAKAFLLSWSVALAREMKAAGRDVEIVGIHTGTVRGTATNPGPGTLFSPSAEQFARAVVGKVGCGLGVVSGWWAHATLKFVGGLLPESMFGPSLEQSIKESWNEAGKKA